MSDKQPESYWTAVGNIIRERPYGPDGAETRYGTKHFAPGAKVYIIDWYPGMCESIVVVGQHRKSKRLITLSLDVRLVENLRAKVCYNPTVIAKFKEHYSPKAHYNAGPINALTKELAETMCRAIPQWQRNYKTKSRASVALTDETTPTISFLVWLQKLFR
ncbi:hypothetical protein [Hymenobacter pini]|uniref:hypothetical protein n=1 Tax=Hymenobacter pini TaxID=2880879 RepID=UPI001CF35E41|nr:hypothetical protein [Hymenobacter pini]MCA8830407.1 hypothetical protein [Hymenobacter pini]